MGGGVEGEIATEARRLVAKRPGGKRRIAEEMVFERNDSGFRRQDSRMCFTDYKISLRQTL